MEKATPAGPKIVEIGAHQLTLPELSRHKQRIDQELSHLQDSIHTLKVIQSKFQESKKSVEKAQKYPAGRKLLVPLSGSVYVDGEIAETDSFIINLGTGYYIRKDAEGAKDYFQRRITYTVQQIETLQTWGNDISRVKDGIVGEMQEKIQALAQQAKAKEES